MRITVNVPDDLHRRIKVESASSGRTLSDLAAEGLRLVLRTPARSGRPRSLAELMEHARGVIDPGVSDLATNSRHFANFGRDASRR
jgi:hypothetical protein